MRLSQTSPTLISLLLTLLSHTETVTSVPILEQLGFGYLQDRSGYTNCGAQGQYTCTGAEACYTNAQDIAYCSVPADAVVTDGSGVYVVYTTVYTETDLILRTSIYSSWYAAATTTSNWVGVQTSAAICIPTNGESSCGAICCASTQTCAFEGSCALKTAAATSSSYSAPLRVTSGGTSVVSVTTTQPFITPATASGSTLPIVASSTSHGLSAGAIAGIVIGVIVGLILLLLLCFCCIVKAGFDGLLALFGLGKRKRRSTETVEVVERYSRHGSGTASRREAHSGWFGGAARPARVVETRKKKSSGLGGFGAVGAGLLGLAVILGLKRKHDKKEMRERSDIASTYYTDSLTGTSASSASSSSDRRTRESRRH